MNRSLMPESPICTRVRNLKSKRVLQVLQVSASDKDLLVSPNLMSGNKKKPAISQKRTEVSQNELLSKENTPVVPSARRSKRKNAVAEEVNKTTSKEGTKTKASSNKVSKVTKSKKTSTKKNKKPSSADPKQSKMDSFIACSSTSNTIFESNLENEEIPINIDTQLQKSENSVEAVASPSYIPHSDQDSGLVVTPEMLTSAKPSEKYWEILAEERRVALEQALQENEELYDQLQVLEAENSQLKDILKEAEVLATVAKQILE